MFKREEKLVAIAEFSSRDVAEEAWGRLNDAEIPASVVHDPGPFGAPVLTRVMVARKDADDGQRLIADLIE